MSVFFEQAVSVGYCAGCGRYRHDAYCDYQFNQSKSFIVLHVGYPPGMRLHVFEVDPGNEDL
jgi:hypothetical protein